MESAPSERLVVTWEVGERLLSDEQVCEAVDAALREGGHEGLALSLVLVDDETLAGLHERWMGDPSQTDVISFDLRGDEGGMDGEVYVSVDRACVVAERRGISASRELTLYLVHGVLHLCGHDDIVDDERARMRVAEARVLDALGYPADTAEHEELD